MEIVRVWMVVVTGLGLTWLAQQVVEGPPLHAQTPAAEPSVPSTGSSSVDRVLEEADMAGGGDDLEEFTPKKPLSADQAVSMPSDI